MNVRDEWRLWIVIVVAVVGTIAMFFIPPIAQDPAYHQFADNRQLFGIQSFWNVMTNIPFFLVGLVGLRSSFTGSRISGIPQMRSGEIVFFVGVALIGMGSAYYHHDPSNASLVWDRLPMTVSFMALFALVVGDSIAPSYGKRLLWPLIGVGVGTVWYWYGTEIRGAGDLRPYGLIQFLPMLLLPLIFVLFGSKLLNQLYLWAALGTYLLAKIAEHFDSEVYDLTRAISGHSVKHLLASLATFWVILALKCHTESKQRPEKTLQQTA